MIGASSEYNLPIDGALLLTFLRGDDSHPARLLLGQGLDRVAIPKMKRRTSSRLQLLVFTVVFMAVFVPLQLWSFSIAAKRTKRGTI